MNGFIMRGESLRTAAKSLVIEFMTSHPACQQNADGLRQSEIFRSCGLDWGNQKSSTSSNQQYWLVGLLRSLESDGITVRVGESGPWRLKQ